MINPIRAISTWWRGLSRSVKSLVGGGGFVVLLAIVVIASAALAPVPDDGSDVQTFDSEITKAIEAIDAGDADVAQGIIDGILATDPANKAARNLDGQLKSKTSGAGSGTISGTTPDNKTPAGGDKKPVTPKPAAISGQAALDKRYAKVVKNIGNVFPDEFTGYRMASTTTDSGAATKSALPEVADTSDPVQAIQWAIVDQGSKSKAQAYLKKTKETVYPKSAGTTKVSGVSAAVGTNKVNDMSWAAVTMYAGRYSVQVLVTGKPGKSASELLAIAKTAAAAMSL